MNLVPGIEQFTLSFDPSTEPDVVAGGGYEVFAVPASELVNGDFVPSVNNRVYKGPDTSITVKVAAGIWAVKAAAYDAFGDTGLNYTPLMTCQVESKLSDILDLLTGEITRSQLHQDLQQSLDDIIDVSKEAADAVAAAADAIEAKTAAIAAQNAAAGSADAAQTAAELAATHSAAAGESADAANTSATAAATSAGAAGTSALAAQEAATSAETAASDAGTHAAAAASSAQSAASYSTSAEAAATSATSAKTSAEAANTAAGNSASAASTSSTEAAASASSAASSASTATTQANQASTQAGYAQTYAGQAATSSTDAQTAASNAATYASSAQGYAATAVSASSSANAAADTITAQYTIKVDANGRVAGIGLWSDGATSRVEILADQFAIVNSVNGASIVPFIVSGGVVYMNAAYVSGTLTATNFQTAQSGERFTIDTTSHNANFYEAGVSTPRITIGTGVGYNDNLTYGQFGHLTAGNSCSGLVGLTGSGYALQGVAQSGQGVYGITLSGGSAGVVGSGAGNSYGVWGMSSSGDGVRGESSGAIGVHGIGLTFGGYFESLAGGEGLRAVGSTNVGVHGKSTSNTAIFAESTSGIGLQANSASNYGVVGANTGGNSYDFYAAGNGSNYGPFTGAHDALAEEDFAGVPGDLVVDQEMLIKKGISSTLGVVRLSDTPEDKKVFGVVAVVCAANDPHLPAIVGQNQYALQLLEGTRCLIVNAIGEGEINVCKDGGDIEAGDYLCSSARPGKAMRQPDDLLHNYTVAKAREPVVWQDGEDDIRQIACTYHCG